MKVDIITRQAVPNYGSLLQTYATQKIIEKFGYDAEVIDYIREDEKYENLYKSMIKGKKWEKNFFLKFIYYIIQMPNYSKMYRKFEEYRKGFLNLTPINYNSLRELIAKPPIADVFISGSDQIWGNIGTDDFDPTYFLEFVNNNKCIAYSSSFGKNELSDNLNKNLHKLLKKYNYIYVREKSAKQILLNKGFKNVEQVLDPTLLLTKDEWKSLAERSKTVVKKKYVLVYQLHTNKDFNKYAKKFARKAKMKLVRISPSLYHIVRGGKFIWLPNQYEFLNLIMNAEYVLTDSFHATVFSIIFNKRFVEILPKETSTRIISILELVNLDNRILKDYSDFSFINKDINFAYCNKKIAEEKEKSISLLKQAIINTINKKS